MPNKFKKGDAVVLKKGSDLMTIKGYAIKQTPQGITLADDKYICSWMKKGKFKKGIFGEDELEKINTYVE